MATVEALKEKNDIELIKTVLKQQNIRHSLILNKLSKYNSREVVRRFRHEYQYRRNAHEL